MQADRASKRCAAMRCLQCCSPEVLGRSAVVIVRLLKAAICIALVKNRYVLRSSDAPSLTVGSRFRMCRRRSALCGTKKAGGKPKSKTFASWFVITSSNGLLRALCDATPLRVAVG